MSTSRVSTKMMSEGVLEAPKSPLGVVGPSDGDELSAQPTRAVCKTMFATRVEQAGGAKSCTGLRDQEAKLFASR